MVTDDLDNTNPSFKPIASAEDANSSIVDNSKRSVSIRINTSDCGRVKTIAQRLRVRDSDVFRYLIQRGLKDLAPLFHSEARSQEIVAMLADSGADLINHFNLDAARIGKIVESDLDEDSPRIDPEDLELLSMLCLPPRYLAFRLSELTESKVNPTDARAALLRYIDEKYTPLESEAIEAQA